MSIEIRAYADGLIADAYSDETRYCHCGRRIRNVMGYECDQCRYFGPSEPVKAVEVEEIAGPVRFVVWLEGTDEPWDAGYYLPASSEAEAQALSIKFGGVVEKRQGWKVIA